MARIEKSIEVEVPVQTAYNQMTQFESFPQFMEHVHEVRQIDDTHLHWRADVGGKEMEWDAEIYEQVPDQLIAWRSTDGGRNSGEVRFTQLGDNKTRLAFTMEVDQASGGKHSAEKLSTRTEKDLQRFKQFIESQGQETGAWRGEVHGAQPQSDQNAASSQPGQQGGQPGQNTERNQGNQSTLGNQGSKSGQNASAFDQESQQATEEVARAAHVAVDQVGQLGKKAFEATSENIGRIGRQASDLTSQALKSQEAIQSSAMEAANAAFRPIRSALPRNISPWLSMFNAFEEPFSAMRRLTEEMQREFENMWGSSQRGGSNNWGLSQAIWAPRIDVSEQNGQLLIQADVPGINKDDVEIEVMDGQLLIRGERREQRETSQQGYRRTECSYGQFTRMIPLPENAQVENAQASMENGVLQIKVPVQSAQERSRKIQIRDSEEQSPQQRGESSGQQPSQWQGNEQRTQRDRRAAA